MVEIGAIGACSGAFTAPDPAIGADPFTSRDVTRDTRSRMSVATAHPK
ncbi:hypothetical protein [Streptomyces alboniger]|nr:hypothetical protein [Streptomyces alboniger]